MCSLCLFALPAFKEQHYHPTGVVFVSNNQSLSAPVWSPPTLYLLTDSEEILSINSQSDFQ